MLQVVLMLVSACGSSGPPVGPFVSQADSICQADSAALKAVALPQRLVDVGPYSGQVADVAAREVHDIKRLALPKSRRRTLDAMLQELHQVELAARAAAQAAGRNDPAGTQAALARLGQHRDRASTMARVYGLNQCATG